MSQQPVHHHLSTDSSTSPSALAPYRIPIQIVSSDGGASSTLTASAPNFLRCLIDHLLTKDQRDTMRRHHQHQRNTNGEPGEEKYDQTIALASQRPIHDRLPLTFAITTANKTEVQDSVSTASTSCDGGVSAVTLIQSQDFPEWIKLHTTPAGKTITGLQVPLAHASRCPCRSSEAEDESTDSASSAPTKDYPLLRLAVVVVPTILNSISHCSRCAPSLPPCATPCPRVLVTRRPRSMRAYPGCWVFPGGACDREDHSLEHTGCREVLEETGLRIDESSMKLVSLWEAVSPVIRPIEMEGPFIAKARYVIAMYAGQVTMDATKGTHCASDATTASGSSSSTAAAPICVGCSVPLQLCPTEVDAGVWLTGAQFDSLRPHAAYFHTEDEASLQRKPSSEICLVHPDKPCQCEILPAHVTSEYYKQHPLHTVLATSSTDPSTAATEVTNVCFHSARIRACALYGLYPNQFGSGMAEGHLVALEEMREQGLF